MVYLDNQFITNWYTATGELTNQWGARTFPVAYTFDYAGRLKTLTT